jgi:hypothetical protein
MPYDVKAEDLEELQVRKTAQRILLLHLRAGSVEQPNEGFWPDIDLDFSGATLVGLNLTHCSIRSIVCFGAEFHELTSFRGTEFRTKADFNQAEFTGRADFRGTVFGGSRDSFNGALLLVRSISARRPWHGWPGPRRCPARPGPGPRTGKNARTTTIRAGHG